MGIKDLYSTLDEICPGAMEYFNLSDLSGYRVAIDVSIFLYKFVRTSGADTWFNTFIVFACSLKKNGIRCIFIFDGKNPPIEKKEEQIRRREETSKIKDKIKLADECYNILMKEYVEIKNAEDSEEGRNLMRKCKDILLNTKTENTINFNDEYSVANALKIASDKWKSQSTSIVQGFSDLAKEYLDIMGLTWIEADGEAETLCAHLCKGGDVDAVLSEDTDVLAYGTPLFLSRIDLKEETVMVTSFEIIKQDTGFSEEEFRDLCILLTCDYNNSVKGMLPSPDGIEIINGEKVQTPYFCKKHEKHNKSKKSIGIGAKGAVCMIDAFRTLEKVEERLDNPEELKYQRCRELFTLPPFDIVDFEKRVFPISTRIDEKRLKTFIEKNKIYINYDYIVNRYKSTDIKF